MEPVKTWESSPKGEFITSVEGNMNESEKKERADARKKRKRRQMFIGRMIIVILLFIILGLCAFLGKDMLEKKKLRDNREQAATSAESESTADTDRKSVV